MKGGVRMRVVDLAKTSDDLDPNLERIPRLLLWGSLLLVIEGLSCLRSRV